MPRDVRPYRGDGRVQSIGRRREDPMARWEDFRKCPGCGLDIATGEGERSCAWGDCPYLPEDLDVYCDTCRFNFFTEEGNPSCEDPSVCEHGVEPLQHVENVRSWLGRTTAEQTRAT
jgi:hypothetical protein